jgi:preprotein translocase subunit SecF
MPGTGKVGAMNFSRASWIWAVMALLLVAQATAMFIDVQFVGGADIAGYSTWSFGEGTPMPNQEVERATRETIEKEMTAKGYMKVDGKADCRIAIHTKKDEWFDGGLFMIEVLDGDTDKVIWRGKAEGAVNVQSTGKRQKLAQRTVKKMFKKFPDKR